MKKIEVTVKDATGIHARPAGLIAKAAVGFSSTVKLEKDGKCADAKRLLAILSLGAKKDDTIAICAEGADEEAAVQAIKAIIEAE